MTMMKLTLGIIMTAYVMEDNPFRFLIYVRCRRNSLMANYSKNTKR